LGADWTSIQSRSKKTKLNLLLQQRQKEAHEIKARNFAEEAAAKEAAQN